MDVVKPSGIQEPIFQNWNARHPELLQVHAVMQVAEHEHRPAQQRAKSKGLVCDRDVEKKHHSPTKQENEGGGSQPLDADIADGDSIIRGIAILRCAHGLAGAIYQEVMDQMAPAKGWKSVAMEEAVQPVSGKLRDNDGIH